MAPRRGDAHANSVSDFLGTKRNGAAQAMYSSSPLENSQDIPSADEIHNYLNRKQPLHCVFGRLAAAFGAASGAIGAFLASDALRGAPLTLGYALWLTLAAVLAITSAASACTWAILKEGRRRENRQLWAIRDAIKVFLRDGNNEAYEALSAVQGLIDRSKSSKVTPFPRAHS